MQFTSFTCEGRAGLGIADGDGVRGMLQGASDVPVSLDQIIGGGLPALRDVAAKLREGRRFDTEEIEHLAPLPNPGKIVCLGLNYRDHPAEGGHGRLAFPVLFNRYPSSLVAHDAPLVLPKASAMFDYGGAFGAVIGRPGRHIPRERALDHVVGYSIFNDGRVRDDRFETTQWSIGGNFDGTGAFGPRFVTADALPPGAAGLRLRTRLDGQVMQDADTADMVFDVATMVALLSECFMLQTGDVLVMGTPSGVGFARSPKVFMTAGQVCEVEIEGLGVLRNPIEAER